MKLKKGSIYHIKIKGILNPNAIGWMDDVRIIDQENDKTLLAVEIADQSALRGLLDQLWNFNFTIISVEKIDDLE
jgi:hypothetical protein